MSDVSTFLKYSRFCFNLRGQLKLTCINLGHPFPESLLCICLNCLSAYSWNNQINQIKINIVFKHTYSVKAHSDFTRLVLIKYIDINRSVHIVRSAVHSAQIKQANTRCVSLDQLQSIFCQYCAARHRAKSPPMHSGAACSLTCLINSGQTGISAAEDVSNDESAKHYARLAPRPQQLAHVSCCSLHRGESFTATAVLLVTVSRSAT